MSDAVVIGSGPNGLVAANLLADAGWSVQVLEEQPEPGGAVRSDSQVHPGFVHDRFSAFYPLAAASPVLRALRLESHGLRWTHAPHVLAHPLSDGRCAVLDREPALTRSSLENFGTGDAEAWAELCELWQQVGDDLLDALFAPFPPLRAGVRLLAKLRTAGGLQLARTMTLPVRRLGEERFTGEGGPLLLAGNALHADLGPEAAISGGFGWMMSMLGQHHGFPVPQGGSGRLTDALVRRLEAAGGVVRCNVPAAKILVRAGRAVGVRTASGEDVPASRAVLADVSAPALYRDLLADEPLPGQLLKDLGRFHWDYATFKIDWALDKSIPWTSPAARDAGTVHVADGVDALTRQAAQIAQGLVPDRPFLLVGQMTTADASRSPAGTESAWAYTHLPQSVKGDAGPDGLTGDWAGGDQERMADRMEAEIERLAPGFRESVRARRILSPDTLQAHDRNLQGGALNGGTTQMHQQLVFRPVPGTGRPETCVRGLYLSSASAHPGGGVHGAPGANAARAALRATRTTARALTRAQSLHGRRARNGSS